MSGCNMTLASIAKAIDAELVSADAALQHQRIDGVSSDSRALMPGQLFVALKGPNFDAHDYLAQALAAGAVAVMVERRMSVAAPQLVVGDTLQALGKLGAAWRQELGLPMIAVTGSNGKTTVKEIMASILAQTGPIFATKGNLNNDIGVPLTLLSIETQHVAAVVEMGANHAKEIEYLTNLTHPNVAVLTNAAAAHLEGFGSLAGVANAKGEIFQGLQGTGWAVINADDQYVDLWRQLAAPNSIITFGLNNAADVSCQWQWSQQGMQLDVSLPEDNFSCHLDLIGRHNVMNALAAIAATKSAGVPVEAIKQGIEAMQAVPGRLQMKQGAGEAMVIDDTYNANPTSLRAALDVLTHFQGQKVLALGDMGELGEDTPALHREAGGTAKSLGIDRLYALGENSALAVQEFGANAEHFNSHESLVDALKKAMHKDTVVLVKGSRSMKMERVVAGITINSGN